MNAEDFLVLWHGRPKTEPLHWLDCPVYAFSLRSFRIGDFVYSNPEHYRPFDWTGRL